MSHPLLVASQSYPTQPIKPYWTVGRILGLFLGIIILGGIAVFAYSQYRVSQSGALPIVQVTVSGTAQTVGAFTNPVRVEFGKCTYANCYTAQNCGLYGYPSCVKCSSSNCYNSSVSAGVNNGQYSTVLDNHSSFDVFLIYESLGIQSYCYAGSVTINSVSGTYTFDVRC